MMTLVLKSTQYMVIIEEMSVKSFWFINLFTEDTTEEKVETGA